MLTLASLVMLLAAPPAPPTSTKTPPPPKDLLRLGGGYRVWGRSFSIGGTGTSQTIVLQSGAVVDVEWFPAAYFVDDRRADVGITLRADFAPITGSTFGSETVDTSVTRLRTGLMLRFPQRWLEPSVHLGFNVFEATFAERSRSGAPVRRSVPNVSYQGPRLAAALRLVELWRITFELGLGGTWFFSTGQIGSEAAYPGATGGALDGQLAVLIRTARWLDVKLGFDVAVQALTLAPGLFSNDTFYGFTFALVFKGVP